MVAKESVIEVRHSNDQVHAEELRKAVLSSNLHDKEDDDGNGYDIYFKTRGKAKEALRKTKNISTIRGYGIIKIAKAILEIMMNTLR
jgi:hypothetical protein